MICVGKTYSASLRGLPQYEELIKQFNGMSVGETAEEVAIFGAIEYYLGCDLSRHDEASGRTASYNGRLMPYKY